MFLKYIPIYLFILLLDIPGLPTKILCVFLRLPMRATYPAHKIHHHGVATVFVLMEYYAAYVGSWLPTFWENLSVQYSRVNQFLDCLPTLRDKLHSSSLRVKKFLDCLTH